MTLKHRTIRTILRLYPASWRAEYGDELHDVLMARPLSLAVLIDVAWNGVVQRARSLEVSAVCGLAGMTAALIALVWNIVAPSSSWYAVSNLLRPSEITLPTIKFSDAASNVFIPLLLACGASIQMRHCGPLARSGWAAVRATVIASAPIVLLGVLMLAGVVDVITLHPGDPGTSFAEHGLTYTFFAAEQVPLTPWGVILAPLFALPQCWLWGLAGGIVGRRMPRRRQSAIAD